MNSLASWRSQTTAFNVSAFKIAYHDHILERLSLQPEGISNYMPDGTDEQIKLSGGSTTTRSSDKNTLTQKSTELDKIERWSKRFVQILKRLHQELIAVKGRRCTLGMFLAAGNSPQFCSKHILLSNLLPRWLHFK